MYVIGANDTIAGGFITVTENNNIPENYYFQIDLTSVILSEENTEAIFINGPIINTTRFCSVSLFLLFSSYIFFES